MIYYLVNLAPFLTWKCFWGAQPFSMNILIWFISSNAIVHIIYNIEWDLWHEFRFCSFIWLPSYFLESVDVLNSDFLL